MGTQTRSHRARAINGDDDGVRARVARIPAKKIASGEKK